MSEAEEKHYKELTYAARRLFVKRFKSTKDAEYKTVECREEWHGLACVLLGPRSDYAIHLGPKPDYKVGDWVVDPDGSIGIITGNNQMIEDTIQMQRVIGGGFGGVINWYEHRYRLATQEEIEKARTNS